MLMKYKSSSAFTLIEMLTVMVVIAVLASLVVSVHAFAQRKAATSRAEGEIRTMVAACESYKGDFGNYPRDLGSDGKGKDSWTDDLDPRTDGNPNGDKYLKACLFLYKAISGDAKPGVDATTPALRDDKPDGKPETKGYFEFAPNQLNKNLSSGEIRFIQDPFGNAYGYSTAGAKTEEDYREKLQSSKDGKTPTRDNLKGYNPTFDLWSTGGVVNKSSKPADLDSDRKRWVKNW